MAKKNSATAVKDDPPPQEDKVEPQDENDEETSSEADSSSEGGEEEEEESSEEEEQNPPQKTIPKNNSAEDDEDEEETDTDEDEPPPKTKPIEQTLKPKPFPAPAPARSGTKRPAENNDTKQSNKKKTTASAAEEKNKKKEPEEDNNNKKSTFQRLFTDDDEVAILQGLVDFTAKSGNDPTKHITAFYDIVKKSVHFKVTLDQLRDKVRRLRLRFENKIKSGKTPTFSKPVEETMFELSKKIWGGKVDVNEGEDNGKVNGKPAKKEPAVKKAAARTTKKLVMEPDSPLVVKKEIRKVESGNGKEDTGLNLVSNETLHLEPVMDVVKRGVESIEESKRGELERLMNKFRIAEMELFMQKTELAKDSAIKIRDALNSSSSH